MTASTPLNGSSSSSRRASWATARASRTRSALPAGQHAEAVVGPVGEADLAERVHRHLAVGGARPAHPADLAVAAHQHDLQDADRELPVEDVGLRHVGDLAAGALRRGAEHLDGAGDDRHEAEDRLDQRGLAGPVRPDQRERAAFGHRAGDAADDRVAVVCRGHPVEHQHVTHDENDS
ncbi:MAG: hypothetical protein QM733_10545 [Ilumatobacteraceae bacterium]